MLLYLEDNGYLCRQTEEYLVEDGYKVQSFTRIDQAIQYLKDHPNGEGIDCIITDMNMDDEWLGEFQGESYGGLLSGWVWLRRFVYISNKYQQIPCIVYSGYIQELRSYLEERHESDLLVEYDVTCISKGGNNNQGYGALYRKLKEIIKK